MSYLSRRKLGWTALASGGVAVSVVNVAALVRLAKHVRWWEWPGLAAAVALGIVLMLGFWIDERSIRER